MTEKSINGKFIRLMKGDVTDVDADAFVFYATENLVLGSGYGTAISLRGGPSIQEELNKLAPVGVGEAVVTGGGQMKASYIIHAVGPKFQEADEEKKLRKAIVSALKRAEEKGIKRLAFPPMGTGFYGIPADTCARVMLQTIRECLNGKTQLEEVIICMRDTREVKPFSNQLEAM
jgi:O-acetyl-ADP-ribose deacetylase (regulator of RNase III)